MSSTRIDSAIFSADMREGLDLIQAGFAKIRPYLVLFTPDQRAAQPRPPAGFIEKAPAFVRLAASHPKVAEMVDFDGEAVAEDIANVQTLTLLEEVLDEIGRLVADTRLLWLAEAYVQCLELHAVARTAARRMPELEQLVELLAGLFARRGRKPATATEG